MNKYHQRIGRIPAACMLTVAILFDLMQIGAKLFIFLGLAVVGGVAGALLGSFIGLTETGGVVGTVAGAVGTFTGIGSVAAATVGLILSATFSIFFAILGYATLSLWFLLYGVSPLSGKRIGRKMTILISAMLVDVIPILNAAPGLTVWTIATIMQSRTEDKEKAKELEARYNTGNARMRRQYVHTDDNDAFQAEAA